MKIYRIAQGLIKAYHGTCEKLYEMILEGDGLVDPYLTSNVNIAKYYAEEAAINYKYGKPIVLEVSVPSISNLRYDGNAMDEPIMASVIQRDRAWNKAAKDHPEWVEDDTISIPETEWKISWDAVYSARYEGVIPIGHIKKIG